MKLRITKDVDSHHTNPNYRCLVVEWNGDKNFRCRHGGAHDWMPTDAELLELLVEGVKISPTLWPQILEVVKPVNKLHELL